MTILIALGIALALVSVVLFPFVGFAMLLVVLPALLVAAAWFGIVARRGPRALPERTTSPSEPDELGTER